MAEETLRLATVRIVIILCLRNLIIRAKPRPDCPIKIKPYTIIGLYKVHYYLLLQLRAEAEKSYTAEMIDCLKNYLDLPSPYESCLEMIGSIEDCKSD